MSEFSLTPRQRLERAERVKALLREHPDVAQALRDLEESSFATFIAATTDADRLNAWAEARALRRLNGSLTGMMEDGERAGKEIEDEERRQARKASTTTSPDAR